MSHDDDSESVCLHKPDCDSVPFPMPDACTEDRDFDRWDREASDVVRDDPPLQPGDVTRHQAYGYRLNEKLLDATPLRERLLFKTGGTLDAFVVCHASLRSLFEGAHAGVELQAVADD